MKMKKLLCALLMATLLLSLVTVFPASAGDCACKYYVKDETETIVGKEITDDRGTECVTFYQLEQLDLEDNCYISIVFHEDCSADLSFDFTSANDKIWVMIYLNGFNFDGSISLSSSAGKDITLYFFDFGSVNITSLTMATTGSATLCTSDDVQLAATNFSGPYNVNAGKYSAMRLDHAYVGKVITSANSSITFLCGGGYKSLGTGAVATVEDPDYQFETEPGEDGFYDLIHLNHYLREVSGHAATESAAGWKAYYECACGAYFEDKAGTTPIPNLTGWLTEGGAGYIPPIHVHTGEKQNGQPATEEADGFKDYYACDCGIYFEDEDCTVEIGDDTALADWKAEGGNGHLDKLTHSHNFVKHNAVEAGKDTAGCKEYYVCSCGEAYEDEARTKKIENLGEWMSVGGAGYLAPTGDNPGPGGDDPEPGPGGDDPEPSGKGGANLVWLWILLGVIVLLLAAYVVFFFLWKKNEEMPAALAFLGFLVPSYKAINGALFKKEEKKE